MKLELILKETNFHRSYTLHRLLPLSYSVLPYVRLKVMLILPSVYWFIQANVASHFMGFKIDQTLCRIAWIGDQAVGQILLTQEDIITKILKS